MSPATIGWIRCSTSYFVNSDYCHMLESKASNLRTKDGGIQPIVAGNYDDGCLERSVLRTFGLIGLIS